MIPGTKIRSAGRLREEFDASFAEPLRVDGGEVREFVLVAAGKTLAALPVTEIRGIEHGVEVVGAPSRVRSLLGLAGVRSAVVPVFSLPALLGAAAGEEGWERRPVFALLDDGRGGRVGLGFERVVRFVRVGEDGLGATAHFGAGGGVGAALRHEDEMFQIVEPGALLQGILRGRKRRPKLGPRRQIPGRWTHDETNLFAETGLQLCRAVRVDAGDGGTGRVCVDACGGVEGPDPERERPRVDACA